MTPSWLFWSLFKGVSQAKLAEQYGVGKSTISDIKRSERKVKEYASTLDSQGVSTSRKVMQLAKEDKLEEAMYKWNEVCTGYFQTPVSGWQIIILSTFVLVDKLRS